METVIAWLPVAVVLAGALAGGVIVLLGWLQPRPAATPAGPQVTPANSFLFKDGEIVDDDLGEGPGANLSDWAGLRRWLGARFAGLPEDLPDLNPGETRDFAASTSGDAAFVTLRGVRKGGLRFTLTDPSALTAAERHDALCRLDRSGILQQTAHAAPCAICRLGADGRIEWHNAEFDSFAEPEINQIVSAAETGAKPPIRLTETASGQARYFDLKVEQAGASQVIYASDVTNFVQADAMRSSFIQTLTKTFADLATGLAVFDRKQTLVLFNPAMIDLTGLPAEFLSARPGVMEFFDVLRDRQVLPEPKNYASWRAQIADMVRSAVDGHYCEAWSLPNGLTYRVTGRPHPDGAIAFLFEDISDEISLTRRSRSQMEVRQAVLDRMEDAVAVTGPNGLLVFCNHPFRQLLGFDPDRSFAETGLDDLLAIGRSRFPDDAFWARATKAAGRSRVAARLQNGPEGPVLARVEPLPGGFAMLRLSPVPSESAVSA